MMNKRFLLGIAVAFTCFAGMAGTISGTSLLEISVFTSDPCSPALPTTGTDSIKYNNDGIQWATTAASVAGDDYNVSLIDPNLLNDASVTTDPDYNPSTTKLMAITPNFSSSSFALAATANLDSSAQIDAFYTITITTTGGTYTATSGMASILDGSLAGQNTTAINAMVAAFNAPLSWDVNPFVGAGIVYDSIAAIDVVYTVNTIEPNDGATGTTWFTLKSMPIEYTAETVYTPPLFDLSVGWASTNGSATDVALVSSGSNAVFGASSVSVLEISKSGGVRTADKVKTDATVFCDGTLNVVQVPGGDALAAGDAFDLLDGNINGAITGSFDAVNLPALDPGLEWTTNTLYTQGFIWVRETNAAPAVAKPNVIILFADDLGYADCGFQPMGSIDIVTPNIDTIAENGVVFTAGYANGPVCSPSRGGLMTGQYQNRFALHDTPATWHMEDPETGEMMHDGIPPGMTCFGHRMQDLGYATGMIGKWHGGETREHYPPHRGFDEFFGFNNGAHTYWPLDNYDPGDNLNRLLMRGMFPVDYEPDYLTDAFGREAVSFINRHANEPFFLYVPFNAPHGPMTACDRDSQLLFGKNAADLTLREKLISMVYTMDVAVGDILDAVESNGLLEETLIVFYSDNGGKPSDNGSYNTPLRGQKGDLWDGGIREPFCMQWKGQLPEGISYDFVVSGLDMMPTAVTLAGGSFSTNDIVDGNNIMPAVTGQTGTPPNDIVVWWHNGRWVSRDNEWKLVDMGGGPELYHIIDDIAETTDVYSANPDVVDRLYNYYTNLLTEFDLVTDASKWSSNEVYYIDIRDPANYVIYEATNTAQWVESAYPGTDMDNDGISNLQEFLLGLPIDSPSVLSNGLAWNLDPLAVSNSLNITFRERIAATGENAIPVPAYAIEQVGSLTGAWASASASLVDGPNPTGDPDYEEKTYRIDINPSAEQGFFRLRISE